MSTTVEVPLSDETRTRLRELAERAQRSEAEVAAALIEGALAAAERERELIQGRLAKADAGGPFVRHEEVLAWLDALAEGEGAPPPKATVTF